MLFRLSRVPELADEAILAGVVGEEPESVAGAAEEVAALVGVGGDDPLVFTVRPEAGAAEGLFGVSGEELVFAVVPVAGGFESVDETASVVVGTPEGSVSIVSEVPGAPELFVGSALVPEDSGAAQFTSVLEVVGATSLGADVAVTTGVVAVSSAPESSVGPGTFNHPICW
jgi:hypothetical protein